MFGSLFSGSKTPVDLNQFESFADVVARFTGHQETIFAVQWGRNGRISAGAEQLALSLADVEQCVFINADSNQSASFNTRFSLISDVGLIEFLEGKAGLEHLVQRSFEHINLYFLPLGGGASTRRKPPATSEITQGLEDVPHKKVVYMRCNDVTTIEHLAQEHPVIILAEDRMMGISHRQQEKLATLPVHLVLEQEVLSEQTSSARTLQASS